MEFRLRDTSVYLLKQEVVEAKNIIESATEDTKSYIMIVDKDKDKA